MRAILYIALGYILHFVAIESAQWMAAGRLIAMAQCTDVCTIKQKTVIEAVLGYRLNMGQYRYMRYYRDFMLDRK